MRILISILALLSLGALFTGAACSSTGSTDTGQDWPDDTSCAAWCVCNGVIMQPMLFGCESGPSCASLNADAGDDGGACECVQMPQ